MAADPYQSPGGFANPARLALEKNFCTMGRC
jgi:hypothetical protein